MAKAKQPARVPRLSLQDGRYYWKPEARLRPEWKTTPLGPHELPARTEARRLNAEAAKWLKQERPAAPARRVQPRTVGELIELFRAGPVKERAPRTQLSYNYELDRLFREFGHEPAATLDTVRVDDWADTLRRKSPSTLRLVAGRGRQLYAWAQRKKLVTIAVNPFAEMRNASGGKRSFVFSWADVQHIVRISAAEGRPSVGQALAVGFLTIQRITDVLALTTAHLVPAGKRKAGDVAPARDLRFRQNKTGFAVDMQWPTWCDTLLALPPVLPKAHRPLIVSEDTGKAYNEKTFSRVFARVLAAAIEDDPRKWKHLKGGQARDGRRSGFVHCYEAGRALGVDVPDICALSGHSLDEGYAIIEHYLPKTRTMADRAAKAMAVR